ncbi:hypothetical protein ACU635_36385 [[Actinomadura] parvosata]|uniref:hypothetical protein n=1 Tax=[Actinomadura] parvosata TaxID=1955412 RepID=UPI00406C3C75
MRNVTLLRRFGLVSALAVGLAITPAAAHAEGYDTPRSATAVGAGNTYAEGVAAAERRARQAVLSVGHDCTPGTYYTSGIYSSPGGGTWVFQSTHEAVCVD